MGHDETTRSRPLRSARWFRKDDLPGFVHRSTLSASGWSRQDLMTRPVVGILNTWSDINPCNLNLRALAEEVRTGILEAGGIPFEAPLLSISENIIKPAYGMRLVSASLLQISPVDGRKLRAMSDAPLASGVYHLSLPPDSLWIF